MGVGYDLDVRYSACTENRVAALGFTLSSLDS